MTSETVKIGRLAWRHFPDIEERVRAHLAARFQAGTELAFSLSEPDERGLREMTATPR